MDDEASRQSGPLRIIHLGIPPAGNNGERTEESRASSLRSHAECQRQCIRAHAKIKIRAGGNPPDASPHNGLPELPHLYNPICKIRSRSTQPSQVAREGRVQRCGAVNLSNVAMPQGRVNQTLVPGSAALGYRTFLESADGLPPGKTTTLVPIVTRP